MTEPNKLGPLVVLMLLDKLKAQTSSDQVSVAKAST